MAAFSFASSAVIRTCINARAAECECDERLQALIDCVISRILLTDGFLFAFRSRASGD